MIKTGHLFVHFLRGATSRLVTLKKVEMEGVPHKTQPQVVSLHWKHLASSLNNSIARFVHAGHTGVTQQQPLRAALV